MIANLPTAVDSDGTTHPPLINDSVLSVGTLWRETCPPAVCVRAALAPRERHEQGYHPGQYDEAVISPDGHWVAFTAEHIYGPEDLLVISPGR